MAEPYSSPQRIVVVGAGGRLGAALAREYAREHRVVAFNHAQLDIGDAGQLHGRLDATEFDVLINCAAQTNVDRCETEGAEAFVLNAEAPRVMAEIATAKGAKLIHISTDYVFDGEATKPYSEEDEALPISVYGDSKLAGERHVLAAGDRHLVVRVSWVFGPDRPSFVDGVIQRAREHEDASAVADKFATPTYTLDVAELLRPLIRTDVASGLLHLANSGECSWQEYGQWALDCCHEIGVPLKARIVKPLKLTDMTNFVARRPPYTVLSTARYEQLTGVAPRSWRDAVADHVRSHVASARS